MPRRLRGWAALALLAALWGCSSKKLTVDASFTMPEGVASPQLELVTFLDTPAYKIRMLDRGRIGQVDIGTDTASTDQIARNPFTGQLEITPLQLHSPGAVRGLVVNRTSAEGIEVFRTEPNGAVRRILEFAVPPTRRWLDGGAEMYEFVDADPKRAPGATYYVRGLIGGVAGANSPLSNGSRVTFAGTIANITYTANRDGSIPPPGGGLPTPAESTFIMRWTPVAGTARYWIHVFEYQPRSLSTAQRILTGAPTPILSYGARDIFIASIPGSVTQYKMGDPGASIYTFRTPSFGAEYFVRISALDADGQLIGMTTGPHITRTSDLGGIFDTRDYFADFTDPEVASSSPAAYLFYSRGAARVSPGEDID